MTTATDYPTLHTTDEVSAAVAQRPDVAPFARLVGNWVWCEFPEKPSDDTRQWLKQTGFRWNNARNAWQHSCGHFTRRNRRIDPRQVYGQLPLTGDYCTRDEAGTAPQATSRPQPAPTYHPGPAERFRDELSRFQAI
ncbi:MAG: hypothetical protein ACH37Z_18630 [Anaerolineae bacterium]